MFILFYTILYYHREGLLAASSIYVNLNSRKINKTNIRSYFRSIKLWGAC